MKRILISSIAALIVGCGDKKPAHIEVSPDVQTVEVTSSWCKTDKELYPAWRMKDGSIKCIDPTWARSHLLVKQVAEEVPCPQSTGNATATGNNAIADSGCGNVVTFSK